MKKALISIIIPVFNSEKYLNALFDSIDSQKYLNYEVIIINDGSTDKSDKVCKDFALRNSRVRYYEQKNVGVSNARNFGISLIKGEYVCFIDADDTLSINYLNDFYQIISTTSAELVCCNYLKFYNKADQLNEKKIKIEKKYYQYNKYELLKDKYSGFLWNKIFRSEIILKNEIRFNEKLTVSEDLVFIFDYLKFVNNVICINNCNYFYRISHESLSKNVNDTNWFTIIDANEYILTKRNLYSDEMYKYFLYNYIYYLYEAIFKINLIYVGKERRNKKNVIKIKIKKMNNKINLLSLKQRIKIYIYKYFNNIAFRIKIKKGMKI